ncbi:MAG: hypothetical protein ACRDIL_14720, partial [Candidatus Limnocylindrales bacterium]
DVPVRVCAPTADRGPRPGLVDFHGGGWVAAVDGGRIALAAAGFVLPFAVPLALVALGVRRWQRRRPVTARAD